MRKVIIIPARYGSTRFPGKPLVYIEGKPMIQHVYERALSSGIKEVWVATDDERILQEVSRFGGKALMTANTHICGTDRIAEASDILGLAPEDIVINLQGDQPFFPAAYFQPLIEPLVSKKAKMTTLATPIKQDEDLTNPNKVKVVLDLQGYALYFSRNLIPYFRPPGEPPLYLKHIGVYAYTKEFLDLFVKLPPGTLELTEKLEQLRALEHGYKIAVSIVSEEVPEIDTPEDLEKLKKIRGL
ncbi:3-deoxy-manno-octulosonate cytidylyltransferase [Thermodesulfobacterium sp. TA1]|uniref:3-deoxy-manno-octulosonate cytidylyltransferase n=1 Tax=Thermodesulfobacterium sp. TA1 TaxID=2234087 RepID=UPI001232012C|nr:3-deoxy-manno-octulosonate cytidylyltransferase [Thermodesulfobacterium sp. TA1]QER42051.1 3-deoxy-manno-octulosonate cytidylyltransferase [Thermodesulfobacterium sp. TA1]